VKQAIGGTAIAALLAFAGYTIFVVLVAVARGEGHGSIFWTAIAMGLSLAALAAWEARRLFIRRFANRNAKSF
jgi:hypothetical protein